MPPRLSATLAQISLLLCAATLALWARGLFRVDDLQWTTPDNPRHGCQIRHLESYGGHLHISSAHFDYTGLSDAAQTAYRPFLTYQAYPFDMPLLAQIRSPEKFNHLGFHFSHWSRGPMGIMGHPIPAVTGAVLQIPDWCPATLLAIFPAARALRARRRRSRLQAGLCPHCGYDLRATPNHCPECGQPTAPPPRLLTPHT